MKKFIVLVLMGMLLSSCGMKKVNEWPEWARQDRDSNGAESHVQGRRGIGPGAVGAIQGMFGDAVSRSNESRGSLGK